MSAVASEAVALLRDPDTIRSRCQNVLAAAERDALDHFALDLERLPAAAALTAEVTRRRYPELDVPIHSRLAHFDADGEPRVARLRETLQERPPRERARALLEVVLISVLVDAGSGPSWRYVDSDRATICTRSEGLAVASLQWLRSGALSRDGQAYAVDAERLINLSEAAFARAFQVSADNPLAGLPGRVALLRRLGAVLVAREDLFGADARLGHLLDHLAAQANAQTLSARALLGTLLDGLSPIWPSPLRLHGIPLGDVFAHPRAGGEGPSAGLVPFHKLSQWLAMSLIAPLAEDGVRVTDIDALTGLAEYRNGGLLIDTGVLRAKDPALFRQAYPADAAPIVEWRALTIALLQRLHGPVCAALGGLTATAFPLAAMLEGGTWAAGRQIARQLRSDGSPPIRIESDGNVF